MMGGKASRGGGGGGGDRIPPAMLLPPPRLCCFSAHTHAALMVLVVVNITRGASVRTLWLKNMRVASLYSWRLVLHLARANHTETHRERAGSLPSASRPAARPHRAGTRRTATSGSAVGPSVAEGDAEPCVVGAAGVVRTCVAAGSDCLRSLHASSSPSRTDVDELNGERDRSVRLY